MSIRDKRSLCDWVILTHSLFCQSRKPALNKAYKQNNVFVDELDIARCVIDPTTGVKGLKSPMVSDLKQSGQVNSGNPARSRTINLLDKVK